MTATPTSARPGVDATNAYPVDSDNVTRGAGIPSDDLDRLIAASARPAVTLPDGTEADDWQHDGFGDYRIVYGARRGVAGRPDIRVQPTCIQLDDGSIDNGDVIEGPVVHVDGVSGDPLNVEQARRLGAAITAAADSMAALCPNPADPLDAVSMVQLLDEIAERVSGPGALRAAIAAADPATMTSTDRRALIDLLDLAFNAAGIE